MLLAGEGSFHDCVGDSVVYRNLEPLDRRLPDLREIWMEVGLPAYRIPRKTEPAYARVVARFLSYAQQLHAPGVPLKRLLYIGDTQMNDGTAIANFRDLERFPVLGFICREDASSPKTEEVEGGVFYTNRWAGLVEFVSHLHDEGFTLDQGTAAVIDMDKTALGARGRNDGAIDKARVEAVQLTVEEVLGEEFRLEEFREVYDELNQPQYHPFTGDNQDYLAYISLMLSAGVYDFEEFLSRLSSGELASLPQFVALCGERLEGPLASGLSRVQEEVEGNLARGDPTPFKSFRYREYQTTVARMLDRSMGEDLSAILRDNIVLTQEVMDLARYLNERGVLLFSISDKPDEASIPSKELAERGYLAVHRISARVVGTPIRDDLRALI